MSTARDWTRRSLLGVIRAYQRWLSPVLGQRCRFHPSCSQYAVEAIERFGAGRGLWLAVRRLARCHPFTAGGLDPVPPASPKPGRRDAGTRVL